MGNCKKPSTPLTVSIMDKSEVLTPGALEQEILVLGTNSAGAWAVKPLGTLTLKALHAALKDPRSAFLLLEDAPQEPGTDSSETV